MKGNRNSYNRETFSTIAFLYNTIKSVIPVGGLGFACDED